MYRARSVIVFLSNCSTSWNWKAQSFVEEQGESVKVRRLNMSVKVSRAGYWIERGNIVEVEDQDGQYLVRSLSDNLLDHINSEQRRILPLRLTIESLCRCRIGGECESCKGVDDNGHPQ